VQRGECRRRCWCAGASGFGCGGLAGASHLGGNEGLNPLEIGKDWRLMECWGSKTAGLIERWGKGGIILSLWCRVLSASTPT
jgi:hypothetical protein